MKSTAWLLALLISMPVMAEPPVPLLWKVEAGHGTVWLLGSLHVLKPSDYPLDPAIDAVFADAERLVFEVPAEAMAAPDVVQRAQALARFDDGRRLRDVLSPTARERLAAFLGSEAAQAAADAYEPWFMGMQLTMMGIAHAGFDPQLGLDQALMRRAAESGKQGGGLESLDDQFAAMDAIPMAEQALMFDDALMPPAELREELETLHGQWRAGDADALAQSLLAEMREETPQAWQGLVVDRNQHWLPQIRAFLQRPDDTLVVVGSLHLIGEQGLVAALRAEGLQVDRVAPAAID